MVSAKGLYYRSPGTEELLKTDPLVEPVLVQIFGRDPEIMASMARALEARMGNRIIGIDLNMGCPAPKITGNGEGSALMLEPVLAGRVIRAVADAVHIPVSVKFRRGWDEKHCNAEEFACICEQNGAQWITVHPRTRQQQYAGQADWNTIRDVRRAVTIPVVGNGDIRSPEDALRMLDETGCDGLMVGRAALGNPFLFRQIRSCLETGTWETISLEEKKKWIREHAERELSTKGAHGIVELRKHMSWYVRGAADAAELRRMAGSISSMEDVERILARMNPSSRRERD
jgi:nifR3 family TIM-barrel protein